ncbi:hypothetical protein [Maritimibacter sp. UBA3975]|uniref:hypothetical protein n=1 Tax=Maritimibacter sp. UBA3975 TaxID=1946833 RepID=UPI0025BE926A|nr:hypothetical protein [Maritimibacter sp. UBA3975]
MTNYLSPEWNRSMMIYGLGDVLKGGSGQSFFQNMAMAHRLQTQEAERARKEAEERQGVEMAQDAFTSLTSRPRPNSPQGIADDAMRAIGRAPMPRVSPDRAAAIMTSPYVPDAIKQLVMGQFQGPEQDWQVLDGQYYDANNPSSGAQPLPGYTDPNTAQPEYGFNDGYFYDKNNPQAGAKPMPGLPQGGGNDMTESERRIFMFNNIQKQTGPAINTIEDRGFNPANIQDKLADGVLAGNFFKSTEGQMYNAAAGAWAESALRLATGAAATPEEYTRIRNMYFAAPGDSPETIAVKRAMRGSYQQVLQATLAGDIRQDIPNPLVFAVNQFYQQPSQTPGTSSEWQDIGDGVRMRRVE